MTNDEIIKNLNGKFTITKNEEISKNDILNKKKSLNLRKDNLERELLRINNDIIKLDDIITQIEQIEIVENNQNINTSEI